MKEIVAVGGVIPSSPTIRTLGSGFNSPYGVAVDSSGNVFVADVGNDTVKEIVAIGGVIPSSPTIRTLGSGFHFPGAVVVDSSGNVFVADTGNNAIKEIVAVGGVIPSTSTINTLGSGFSGPYGVAVDSSGNVFVADTGNNAIKEIVAVGGVIPSTSTINTLGSGFSVPYGVAVDSSGNVFVADNYNSAVKEIQLSAVNFGSVAVATGTPPIQTLTFVFDTGGTIGLPQAVTQGAAGLDFTDAGTGSCTTNGTSYTYNAGDSCTVDVSFNPKAPGQRQGAVRLVDSSNHEIAIAYIYGMGIAPLVALDAGVINTLPITLASGSYPSVVTVAANGDLYALDHRHCVVLKYSAGVTSQIAGTGTCGAFTGDGGPATSAGITSLYRLALDGTGNLFFGDQYRMRRIDSTTGLISTYAGTGVLGYSPDGSAASTSPMGEVDALVFDSAGNLYYGDSPNSLVRRIDRVTGVLSTVAGVYSTVFGGGYSGDNGPAVSAQISAPFALAFDSSDTSTFRILETTTSARFPAAQASSRP